MRHADCDACRMRHAARVCGDVQQELCVIGRRCAGAQNCVVARSLLQAANTRGCEPHERVIPMQYACESRHESAESVATLNMCELVHECRVSCGLGPGVACSR